MHIQAMNNNIISPQLLILTPQEKIALEIYASAMKDILDGESSGYAVESSVVQDLKRGSVQDKMLAKDLLGMPNSSLSLERLETAINTGRFQ